MAAGASGPTPAPTACTGAGTVGIDGLAFSPAEIPAGRSSTATLRLTNCSDQTQSVRETWSGRYFSAAATGVPAGCPVIDPLPVTEILAPHSHVATSGSSLTFPGCTADGLALTVSLTGSAAASDQATATLRIDHPAATG
ncbi:hypothetical protein [Actinacidiphila sp. ITFR-21]|uniref:hypothetical protein n=1 Tax=Actinacidiphila sp. ITFR-21 TaxID=3075199 RepID=UPI00288BB7A3|nr:hypothetical protein [Streptomyces sp. ITFR-21]WNI14099.1 hypothetical protein RLT57_00200 [Streptomyces sp. ITFR-21]